MTNTLPLRIKTISQCHQAMGLPKPEHPLISVVNFDSFIQKPFNEPVSLIYDFYAIYLKRITNATFKYGHQESDFDEGVLFLWRLVRSLVLRLKKVKHLNLPDGSY